MLARAHRIPRIVTDRRPATARNRTFGKLPNLRRRQARTRPLHRLLLVDLGFGGA